MKRLFVAVALVLAVVLVTATALVAAFDSSPSSGSDAGGPTPVTPSAVPSPTRPPAPALASFYDQHLDWSDCHDGDQCARLTVPLDYRHPSGTTITISRAEGPGRRPRDPHRLARDQPRWPW